MFNEDIFNFNINNIKNDLAIEGMTISDEDITLFKQFATEEIDMPNLIQTIKNEINWNLTIHCTNIETFVLCNNTII